MRAIPIGFEAQPAFQNAVVAIDTTLAPLHLLDGLLAIEAEFKRERTVRWGPRTLDLDLLWFDGLRAGRRPGSRCRIRVRTSGSSCCGRWPTSRPALPLAGATAADLLEGLPPQGVRGTGHALM